MATEARIITLMTVGSETAIRIKTAIDSSPADERGERNVGMSI